jgi:molecular chaperone GrpE (heat shock protein)
MTPPIYESETDDDEQFSIAIDDSILNEALASVEKRMGRPQRQEIDLGALDLSALAAVEDELAIEIEEEDEEPQTPALVNHGANVEARLRAMEAEAETENLKEKLGSLAENRDQIETRMRELSNRAQKAGEAQRLAEQRSKNLKGALEKQQADVERLLERRKKENVDNLVRGRTDALLALADVVDNLVLAMKHAGTEPEKLLEGVQMCLSQFEGGLQHIDVETILPEPGDDFNPEFHEAIANEASNDVSAGKIISVVNRGYRMENRLIRAARVCVSDG